MRNYIKNFSKIFINTYLFHLLILISPSVYTHEGEPSHGGDLPVNLGSNRMQYEGSQKLSDINISKNAFIPGKITIETGGVVAFKNQDKIEHRIVFSMGEAGDDEVHDHPVGGHERSYIIKPEKYWVLEFLVPGLFPYNCSIHGETGEIYVKY